MSLGTEGEEFWCVPSSLDDGPGPELSFFFNILDLKREFEAFYVFRSQGLQVVNGVVLSKKMDVQNWGNPVGTRITLTLPTTILGFTGPAQIISRPTWQLIPLAEEPMPHEISLKIGRWLQFRVVREMSRVLFGRAAYGEVRELVSYGHGPNWRSGN